MNVLQMAEYIAKESSKKQIAAFIIDDEVRTMQAEGKRFDKMLNEYFHRCLGVYYCAPVEWVYEDIVCLSKRKLYSWE
jgi:hypothetical protein